MSNNTGLIHASLKKRYAREKRFKFYGVSALVISFLFLIFLLTTIVINSIPAFTQHYVKLTVDFSPENLRVSENSDNDELRQANFNNLVKQSIYRMFPDVSGRKDKRKLRNMISGNAQYVLRDMLLANPALVGTKQEVWVRVDDDIDVFLKEPDFRGRISDFESAIVGLLKNDERIENRFNTTFFTAGDSREPEQAGIRGALTGSFLTMLVTVLLSFPIGVAAAIYLEEFAPKNRWIDLIEININNLAAVPSIVFGILGLAVFINVFDVPRSAPLVGGLVLTLMTLPTIIISSRAAIKSVPPSIREAALAMGASRTQTVFHHVVPLAMPGILTGTIIGMAQALGESAPLLMIGMVAFVADVPGWIMEPATVLPVQVYIWSDSPERSFTALTSAAIMVLLIFLMLMNIVAVVLRKKFERRW